MSLSRRRWFMIDTNTANGQIYFSKQTWAKCSQARVLWSWNIRHSNKVALREREGDRQQTLPFADNMNAVVWAANIHHSIASIGSVEKQNENDRSRLRQCKFSISPLVSTKNVQSFSYLSRVKLTCMYPLGGNLIWVVESEEILLRYTGQ